MGSEFRSTFTSADMINTSTACIAGQYNKIGEYKVQAGVNLFLGYGAQSGQENAQGRIYADIRTAAISQPGKVRISIVSPQDIPLAVLFEARTEVLNTSATDRTKMIPFPKMDIGASQDKKYVMEFMPDAAATITKANSVMIMDITNRLL